MGAAHLIFFLFFWFWMRRTLDAQHTLKIQGALDSLLVAVVYN
jgi:hypothetical protein